MSGTAVFFDGNWLLHRAQSAIGGHTEFPDKKIPLLVLNWFCDYAMRFKAEFGALCFDGANNFRYGVYSGYKASRSVNTAEQRIADGVSKSDNTYAALQPTLSLFNMVGVASFQHPNYEADDLVAAGAYHFTRLDKSRRAIIVCRDKDLLSQVSSQVTVWTPEMGGQPEVTWNEKEVKAQHGLSPRQFRDYQILLGDKIDDIPGILPKAKAKKLIVDFKSIKAYLATAEGKEFFTEHGSELMRNKQLISMARDCWTPTDSELRIKLATVNDADIQSSYGSLPKSVSALRSFNTKKRLF